MKAIILAAGQSKRMAPLPDKNFLPMLGKPLIVHQVEQLRRCGFEDVIVVGGRHNLEELGKVFGSMVSVVEQKKLEDGMAGAVLSVEDLIGDEPFLVVSSNDVIEDSAYTSLLAEKMSALLAKKVTSYFPGGYLKISSDGLVEKILEKPGAGKEPSDLVNIVAHLHREPGRLFEALKNAKTGRDDRYEVALDAMISAGVEIRACVYTGAWQAVKFPWHLIAVWKMLFAREMVLRKAAGGGMEGAGNRLHGAGAQIAETAILRGDVILEDGVRVFDHAVIQGPAYIGKNAVVANNALVRDSHIGEGSVVGFSTEIVRSYLASHVWTHTNYIGDSVIASNVSFGSGAVVANLRLDEAPISVQIAGAHGVEKIESGTNKLGAMIAEGVRIGVNTSIMPGVKIGNNSFVASGLCIGEDIGDRQFVYGKWTLEKRENRTKMDLSAREKMMEKLRKS
ncbi:MAG: NTP transferase domain-containing protein [Patescibacteria group bacterium]|mgnify:CR=1 FL=1